MLQNLSVPWHKAPAEAEAECAKLQKLGIVDAVWTEDSDALMFGATTVLRFRFEEKAKSKAGKPKKDKKNIQVHRSRDVLTKYPGFGQRTTRSICDPVWGRLQYRRAI